MNVEISKPLAAAMVLTVGIAVPACALVGYDWSSFKPTWQTTALGIFYASTVLLFAFAALGVKMHELTSQEFDKRIKERFQAVHRKALPFILSGMLVWFLYILLRFSART